jgi:hypothetical protein
MLRTEHKGFFFFFFIRRLTSFVESFGLLNDVFPFHSVLNTGCPIFNIQLTDILYCIVFPSLFGPSLNTEDYLKKIQDLTRMLVSRMHRIEHGGLSPECRGINTEAYLKKIQVLTRMLVSRMQRN